MPTGYALDPEALGALPREAHLIWARARELGPRLALRSSALDEDSPGSSFAGQHASVLGIGSDAALAEAASRVIASGAGSRPYRAARGLARESVIAAVLQVLVEPVSSGVLFSRHPLSGKPQVVVEASWGLGEAVVQGLVEPDHTVLDRDGRVLEARIGYKDLRIGLEGEVEVPEEERERPCLPHGVLAHLASHVPACEAVAGGPADVEWAWDGARLWFLQCRAITTLPRSVHAREGAGRHGRPGPG